MRAAVLTHEQRVEIVRRLEVSSHPQARMILECLDRLLSGGDVDQAMDNLVSEIKSITVRSFVNGVPHREYIVDYPHTPYARVRRAEKEDTD